MGSLSRSRLVTPYKSQQNPYKGLNPLISPYKSLINPYNPLTISREILPFLRRITGPGLLSEASLLLLCPSLWETARDEPRGPRFWDNSKETFLVKVTSKIHPNHVAHGFDMVLYVVLFSFGLIIIDSWRFLVFMVCDHPQLLLVTPHNHQT